MSQSMGAPQQHKQPSRKGKRAWRKNVDVSTVQDGLEALREDVIQGGPVAEREAKDLFVLDTAGSDQIKKTLKLPKLLKADEILSKRSAIKAVDSRKRPNSRVTDGILPATKRQKNDWVSKKEVLRLKEVAQGGSILTSTRLADDESAAFDLWGPQEVTRSPHVGELEFVPELRDKVAPKTLQLAPVAMTANGKAVKAVRNPDSGTSYNPTFEDWDKLVVREGQKEVEAEKLRVREAGIEAERDARIALLIGQDLEDQQQDESTWEGLESESEVSGLMKSKRPERKTQAQRNKIKRRKDAERLIKHVQQMSNKRRQALQLEEAMKATKEQTLSKALAITSEETESHSSDDDTLRRKSLGNTVIPEKALELVLPDELQESLRRLKPEGNLLNDRFRNLLVNGKIEARKPIFQAKKKRRTYTEKWSHKDFSVEV